MSTIADIAKEALKHFRPIVRNPSPPATAWTLSDDRPEWLFELAREVHGDHLPNDWHHEMLRDCLASISDGATEADDADTYMPYTHDRLQWLANAPGALDACDAANGAFAPRRETPMEERIAIGVAYMLDETFNLALDACKRQAEAMEASDRA
jgi:hypothetical protein